MGTEKDGGPGDKERMEKRKIAHENKNSQLEEKKEDKNTFWGEKQRREGAQYLWVELVHPQSKLRCA